MAATHTSSAAAPRHRCGRMLPYICKHYRWARACKCRHRVKGLVGYPSSDGDYGDGYSLAIALTVAGQRQLLPVDAATLANNPCLAQRYTMEMDLRTNPAVKAGRTHPIPSHPAHPPFSLSAFSPSLSLLSLKTTPAVETLSSQQYDDAVDVIPR